MSVSSTNTKKSLPGDGTAHSFAYDFKIFADADLQVIVRSAAGTETLKTLNTHYIVTNAGSESGGNVLFKFNTGNSSDAHFSSTDQRPQSGETVVMARNLTLTQGTDYIANDPFPAESHEDALDRLTFIAQQQQEELDRAIKSSVGNTFTSSEFTISATDRANKVFAFDGSGDLSITQELGTFRGNWAASTAYALRDLVKDTSTGNIFIVTTAHTSSGSQPLTTNANSASYTLLVDAATATTSAADAQKLAIEAEDSQFTLSGGTQGFSALHHAAKAAASAASAANATADVTLARNYATKTDGTVETSPDRYSAEAHAVGGTGVTSVIGSAKEWAIGGGSTPNSTQAVDSAGEFSAKGYAISNITGGSAKNWALGGGSGFSSNTPVTGSGSSAKYSAQYWAEQAAATKTEFSNIYHGESSSAPTGSEVGAGDLWFDSSVSPNGVLKYYNTNNQWVAVEPGTTAGFAIAMAIAL